MAALLRRRAALVLVVVLTLMILPATALADGRTVLSDYQDNGSIDACYSRADLADALRIARADQRTYANALDVVRQAQITNLAGEDGTCEANPEGTDTGEGGGPGLGLWIGLAVGVGLVAAGAGAWARRNAGDGDEA